MLNNTPNQSSNFKTKNWIKINDESRRTYNGNNLITFKKLKLRSAICEYIDAYKLSIWIITLAQASAAAQNNANKKVILKNCTAFTKCISRISNTQADDAMYIDVVMSV